MSQALRQPPAKIDVKMYEEHSSPVWWCAGCGDFGVLKALKIALSELGIAPQDLALVTGIGCSGKIGTYMNGNNFHGTHGRILPIATGVRIANPSLTVIGLGGDGDGYAIGLGHLPHTVRRNLNITYIVMDNQTYGLTKGQVSPTSDPFYKTSTTPEGNIEAAVNPLAIALAAGATFVARAFSANQKSQVDIMKAGIQHEGFALINIFSPCVTYNKVNTYKWFRDNACDLAAEGHDPKNHKQALEAAFRSDKLPLGIFYQIDRPTFEAARPGARETPMVDLPIEGQDHTGLLKDFA
ncbi:MAG: 2-oxoacid:ferredoxin oxidoreductase subunit beta [Planctomycetota bacterium]|nr:2-oxoacid:ferredoxin oxidoreductase subunit beta [Planctomycetota bacterium]